MQSHFQLHPGQCLSTFVWLLRFSAGCLSLVSPTLLSTVFVESHHLNWQSYFCAFFWSPHLNEDSETHHCLSSSLFHSQNIQHAPVFRHWGKRLLQFRATWDTLGKAARFTKERCVKCTSHLTPGSHKGDLFTSASTLVITCGKMGGRTQGKQGGCLQGGGP